MSDKMKVRDGNDGYSYPYTSDELVVGEDGKSVKRRIDEIESKIKEDGKISIDDSNTATNKTWSSSKIDSQFKDIAKRIESIGTGGNGSSVNLWNNKVASFLGDSITAGINTEKTYHAYLKELIGFKTCNNYGINGASITNHSNGICDRYNNVDANSDIIFVFGGTNDFYYNKSLGDWYILDGTTRTLNTDITTFKGALSTICNGLLSKFPNKQIILMTPIHRYTFNNQQTDFQANASGLYLEDYVDCIKEAGKIFSIPVIDLYNESGLFPANSANASLYFHSSDKLHPNKDGHLKIAKVIQGKLNNIYPMDLNTPVTPITYGNIVLSKTSATIVAGGSDAFTVKLDKAPTNNQIISLSVTEGATLSSNSLTFTPSNYNTEQTITITMDNDISSGNYTVTASSSNVNNVTITYVVNTGEKPCTAISLNNSTLTFTDTNIQTLTPTLTPADTTDTVTWSVNPTGIVSVNAGVVTPIKTGNCIITATCGTKSATCNVTVNISISTESFTINDFTQINGVFTYDNELAKGVSVNSQWAGIRLNNIKNGTYKLSTVNSGFAGQLIWYMYKYDEDYMYVLCLGQGITKEEGKRYKMSINSSTASQIDKLTIPYTLESNEEMKIIVEDNTQKIYHDDTLLAELTDCNTIGASTQNSNETNSLFKNLIYTSN